MSESEWKDGGRAGQSEREEQEFEQALTRALRRVDAPEGFAARMEALAQAERRTARVARAEKQAWWRAPLGWKPAWGAVAALLVAGVLTGHAVHERHEEQVRAQASREFDVSVRITDQTMDRALGQARERLRRAGVAVEGEQ